MKIVNVFESNARRNTESALQRAVIAQTESNAFFCLFTQSTAHSFRRIFEGYRNDVGREIESYSPSEHIFEVQQKTSRKGKVYFQAVQAVE